MVLTLPALIGLAALKTLRDDGAEIFNAQKDALTIEAFSRTDLSAEQLTLLEESLRALEGVRSVEATSPEESLRRLAQDPRIPVDPGWLAQKSQEKKGQSPLLPWSYRLTLERWDEEFMRGLAARVESLELGTPRIRPIAETHYDAERASLVFTLDNYVQWLNALLVFLWAALLAAGLLSWLRIWRRRGRQEALLARLREEKVFLLAWSLGCGAASQLLFQAILSLSFFHRKIFWSPERMSLFLMQFFLAAYSALLWETARAAATPEPEARPAP